MSYHERFVISAEIPQAKVCMQCDKHGKCTDRRSCVDYAAEQIVRAMAMAERRRENETDYDVWQVGLKASRTKLGQI